MDNKTSDATIEIKYYDIDNSCNHNIQVQVTLQGVVTYCTYCGKIFDCKHQQDFAFSKPKE